MYVCGIVRDRTRQMLANKWQSREWAMAKQIYGSYSVLPDPPYFMSTRVRKKMVCTSLIV